MNWDQTDLHLALTGEKDNRQCTKSVEKVIPITNSDDKRQITALPAATFAGKYLLPQLICQGKTERCHPKVSVAEGRGIWPLV